MLFLDTEKRRIDQNFVINLQFLLLKWQPAQLPVVSSHQSIALYMANKECALIVSVVKDEKAHIFSKVLEKTGRQANSVYDELPIETPAVNSPSC